MFTRILNGEINIYKKGEYFNQKNYFFKKVKSHLIMGVSLFIIMYLAFLIKQFI